MVNWRRQKRLDEESKRSKYFILYLMFFVILFLGMVVWAGMFAHERVQLAQQEHALVQCIQLLDIIEIYKRENGNYPSDINVMRSKYINSESWPLFDGWGTPLTYRLANGMAVIESAGPDGKHGTSDDIRMDKNQRRQEINQ